MPRVDLVGGFDNTWVAEVAGVRTAVQAEGWTGMSAGLSELTPPQTTMATHRLRTCSGRGCWKVSFQNGV